MDFMAEEARGFIRDHAEEPFFLYVPFPVPHASLQVPEDSVAEYADAFPETPYLGDRGYLPHPKPRAAYAAMVTRMDREIGSILDLLEELDLAEDTLVLFTSDNGPTFNGGTDSEFFESAAGFRGLKTELYEGGIRVPLVARWPGRIPAGSVSELPSAFWDFLPDLRRTHGTEPFRSRRTAYPSSRPWRDGSRIRRTGSTSTGSSRGGRPFVWEGGRRTAGRQMGSSSFTTWKADRAETSNVASEYPEVVARIIANHDRGPDRVGAFSPAYAGEGVVRIGQMIGV